MSDVHLHEPHQAAAAAAAHGIERLLSRSLSGGNRTSPSFPSASGSRSHDDLLLSISVSSLTLKEESTLTQQDVALVFDVLEAFVRGHIDSSHHKAGARRRLGMDFQVWEWSTPELYGLILGMFVKHGLVPNADVLNHLFNFVVDLSGGYFDNPYHSFLHAADVAYMVYWIMADLKLSEELGLSTVEFVALIIAALTHDILHPGLNNLYHIHARTDLAQRYDFKSILEMQSCDHVRALLQKHPFLQGLSYGAGLPLHVEQNPAARVEEIALEAILNTDMCHHFGLLEQLSCMTEGFIGSPTPSEEDLFEEEDDQLSSENQPRESAPAEPSLDEPPPSTLATQPDSPQTSHVLPSVSSTIVPNPPPNEGVTPPHSHLYPVPSPFRYLSPDVLRLSISQDSESPLSSTHSTSGTVPRPGLPLTKPQRQLMINVLLHAADISNAARPYSICKRWSDMVVEEFFLQGEQEKRMGLPISPNMDRETTNPVQIGFDFNEYVVRPYFEVLAELLPSMRPFVENLIVNRNKWEGFGASVKPPTQASGSASTGRSNSVQTSSGGNSAVDAESPVSRGRRLSLAAGIIEIPQAFDNFIVARRGIKHRYKTSRSLSSGRSRGSVIPFSPSASASQSLWMLENGEQTPSSEGDTPSTEPPQDNLGTLSPFNNKKLFPQRRCMSMDAQATDSAVFQRWALRNKGGTQSSSIATDDDSPNGSISHISHDALASNG
ncbi:hypothetical protein DFS34DRAFT_215550 [Phlyctochytrium arcticum]|nr:hypothetical protein DFS34DRAFT_215550 [Phlyctochytrium arcticum]